MGISIIPDLGVNLLDDQRRVLANPEIGTECLKSKNLVPYKKGMLQKRPAMDLNTDLAEALTQDMMPLSALVLNDNGLKYVVAGMGYNPGEEGSGGDNGRFAFAYSYNHPLVGGWDLHVANDSSFSMNVLKQIPCMVQYNKDVYIFPGGNYYDHISSITGTLVTCKSFVKLFAEPIDNGIGNSPTTWYPMEFNGDNKFCPSVACVYKDRFVYGGLGPGYENYIVFADPGDMQTIGSDVRAANGRAILIGEAEDSDRIVALVPITQTAVGTPTATAILILKEYSAYILTGEPHVTTYSPVAPDTLLGDLAISRISYNCGCSSAATIVTTNHGTFWAGHDDVWFFAIGQLPVRIGTKISPKLKATPAEVRWRWNAAFHDGFYRLALYSEGVGGSNWADPEAGTNSNIPLDPDEQWWLDLRDGPPPTAQAARWWGPQIYRAPLYSQYAGAWPIVSEGVACMTLDHRPNHKQTLIGLKYLGQGWGFMDMEIDAARDCAGFLSDTTMVSTLGWNMLNHDYMIDSSSVWRIDDLESNTTIDMELETKEYDFNEDMLDKLLRGIQVDFWASQPSMLRASVIVDDGVSIGELSANVPEEGFLLGADTLGTGNLRRAFQSTYLIDATANHVGKTFRIKFYDQAEYVINDSNDTFVVLQGGSYRKGVLTHGSYATLEALCDHIVDVMQNSSVPPPITALTHNAVGRANFLQFTFSSNAQFIWQNPGTDPLLTDADFRKFRALFSMLGWNTDTNSGTSTTHVGTDYAWKNRVGSWLLSGIKVDVRLFEREPT